MWSMRQERKSEIARALAHIGTGVHNQRDHGLVESGKRVEGRTVKWLEDSPEDNGKRDSWRFALLPFLESIRANTFDSSWKNGPYAEISHPTYCLTQHQNREGFYTTNCVAIVGPGSLAGSTVSTYEEDAVLVVAVGDTEIPWGMSGDLRLDAQGNLIDVWPGPTHDEWIGVLFGDGRAWLLDKSVPLEKLKLFFTVAEARKHRADEILGPYRIRGRSFSSVPGAENGSNFEGQPHRRRQQPLPATARQPPQVAAVAASGRERTEAATGCVYGEEEEQEAAGTADMDGRRFDSAGCPDGTP